MNTKNLLVLAGAVAFAGQLALAGNSVGNGVDSASENDGAAWFLGKDRKVSVCYSCHPEFWSVRISRSNAACVKSLDSQLGFNVQPSMTRANSGR